MRSLNRHSIRNYEKVVKAKLRKHRGDRSLAFAQSVGSISMETFRSQGDGHVAVLRHHGLEDGMSLYDLGCGCGRTAQALQRAGWTGTYQGADIIKTLVRHLEATCPGYEAFVHRDLSIRAPDASQDMIFHWSVFTHLFPEECFIYMEDIFRALKPRGRLIFSFLEFEDPDHWPLFERRARTIARDRPLEHLDTYLHRDWIATWAERIGFRDISFTSGADGRFHEPFWQSLVAMQKPDSSTTCEG